MCIIHCVSVNRQNIKPAPLSFESSLRAVSSLCMPACMHYSSLYVCACIVCITEGQREGALGVTCHLAIALSVIGSTLLWCKI